jgi:saccharopine dehydrogenase-like NADP-dependent oxidoreductase
LEGVGAVLLDEFHGRSVELSQRSVVNGQSIQQSTENIVNGKWSTVNMIDSQQQSDPSREGVGAVLLDKFHERSVQLSQRSVVNGQRIQQSVENVVNGQWSTVNMIDGRRQSDPSMEGVGAVLLDEFHERSVELRQRSVVNGQRIQQSTENVVNGHWSTVNMIDGRRQSDPSLEGVGAVLLDEFHERSVELSQRSVVNSQRIQQSTANLVNGQRST